MPRERPLHRRWLAILGGSVIALALRLLGLTWRIRVLGEDRFAAGNLRLGSLWHRDALMAAYHYRDRQVLLSVSLSRDGDLFEVALRLMGYARSARGSSSRGATGLLRQLIRGLRAGQTVAVLPDGPKGPPRVAKPGVIALAATAGVPVVPVAFAADREWVVGNWDRTRVPKPFSRVVCRYGEPLAVPRDLDADSRDKLLKELEQRLDAIRCEVDREVGQAPDPPAEASGEQR